MDHLPGQAQVVTAEERTIFKGKAPSERLMRSVAVWRRFGVLTLTQRHFFGFRDGKFHWLDSGSFMRSVAERLIPRPSAQTPIVRACFQRQH